MKNVFLFCCFFLGLNSLMAQNSAFELGVVGGLDYTIGESSSIATSYRTIQHRPTIGASIGIQLSDKWWLRSGLSFRYSGQQLDEVDLRWGSDHNGNGGFEPDSTTIRYNYFRFSDYYLSTPLHVQYRFKNEGRLVPFVEFGTSIHAYLSSKSRYAFIDESSISNIQRDSTAPKALLSADLSAGILWQVSSTSDRFFLMAQPSFSYFIPKNNNGSATNSFSLLTRAEVGLIMKLK